MKAIVKSAFGALMQSLTRQTTRYGSVGGPVFFPVFSHGRVTGVRVDQFTAWEHPAVATSIRLVAESIAMMPWRVFRVVDADRVPASSHPAWRLLFGTPNSETNNVVFRETLLAHALSWGDGFAEIERTAGSRVPVAMYNIEPHRVTLDHDASGNRVYVVANAGGASSVTLREDQMFHVHGLGYDGWRGYSPLLLHALSIGTGIAADTAAGAQFGNGSVPMGIIEHPTLKQEKVAAWKRAWDKWYGGASKQGQIGVLGENAHFKPVSWRPEDIQLLASREFTTRQVAMIFRIPPSKLGDFAGQPAGTVEEQNRQLVADALQIWMTRLEQEANRKLIGQPGTLYSRISPEALLRGTFKTRQEAYRIGHHRWLKTNEIRALEELPGTGPSGDMLMVPLNMVPAWQALAAGATQTAETAQQLGTTTAGPGDGSSGGDVPEAAEGGETSRPGGNTASMVTATEAQTRAAILEVVDDFARRSARTDTQAWTRHERQSADSDEKIREHGWCEKLVKREGAFVSGAGVPLRVIHGLLGIDAQSHTVETGCKSLWRQYTGYLKQFPARGVAEPELQRELTALFLAYAERAFNEWRLDDEIPQ